METRTRRLALAKERTEERTDPKLFKLLLAYYAFDYVRVQDSYLPFLAPLHIPAIITIALAIYVISNHKSAVGDRLIQVALLFLAEIVIWVPFALNNYWAFETAKSMSMTMISVIATVSIIKDTKSLIKLFKAFVFFCVLAAIWVVTHGGFGPSGFLYDQNDVCLLLDLVTPFAWYLAFRSGIPKLEKLFFLAAFALFFVAMVITDSRGGMLGYVAAILTIIIFSKRPVRNITLAIAVSLAIGGIAIQTLPKSYVSDMETITNKNDGTRELRFLHWTTAWAMFKAYPIFGVGPYNYPWHSEKFFRFSPYYNPEARNRAGRQAHSMYFTVIPEEGLVGIILFLTMLGIAATRIVKVRNLDKKVRGDPNLKPELEDQVAAAKMLAGGYAGFLIAGAFISVLYYPELWHLLGFTTALWILSNRGSRTARRDRSKGRRQGNSASLDQP